jgi:hypothetical protein
VSKDIPLYPRVVFGFIKGRVRLETCGGQDWYPWSDRLLLFEGVEKDLEGRKYAVTHLQKRARFWFLLMRHEKWWHLCWHVGITFRFQKPGIPGSELVFYWRAGYSRWDASICDYVKGYIIKILSKTINIPFGTWYGPGLHLD